MPKSALPEHLDEAHEWDGKDDDDHWYTSWRKHVKGWFAFGPRAMEWWAKFREYPKLLVVVYGRGRLRWENTDGSISDAISQPSFIGNQSFLWTGEAVYLSRVQYHTNWHIQLQWPLFLGFHFRQWQGYIGFKRDADRVYWLALYLGKIWK